MEIKASSKYDWKTIKKFNYFHINKRKKFNRVLNIIFPIVLAVLIAELILCLIFDAVDIKFVGLLGSMLFLYGVVYFVNFVLPKIVFKRNKALINTVQSYAITEQEVKVASVGDNLKGESVLLWEAFYKTYETKEFFYFYISPNQAHIIEKDSMSDEDINTLRAHLLKIMGTKHKVIF